MKAAANTLLTNENARILKHTIYEPSLLIFHGMGGHDWFVVCGGCVVILAVHFILFTFTMSNAA